MELDEQDDAFQFVAQANAHSEWMWKVYSKYMVAGFLLTQIAGILSSVILCFTTLGHFDSNIVYYPYKHM